MTLAAVIPTKHHRNPNDVLAPGVIRAMRDDGTVDPAHDPGVSDAELVALYTAMVRVRILDDRLVSLQRNQAIVEDANAHHRRVERDELGVAHAGIVRGIDGAVVPHRADH